MYEIIIPIVILIIIVILFYINQSQKSYITGVWSGEKEFLETSELDELLIVFKDNEMAITAVYEDNIVNDSVSTFTLYTKLTSFFGSNKIYYLETENDTLFPKNLMMKLDSTNGVMILYDDETTYAVLIKNNELSIEI